MIGSTCENPFLGRILQEPFVYESSDFRIVADAAPVVQGHLLLFPKRQGACLADGPVGELGRFLDAFLEESGPRSKFLLVEKGRGQFCSSFGNVTHAHAHIVPQRGNWSLKGVVGQGRSFAEITEALRWVRDFGSEQYLLAGEVGGQFTIVYPLVNPPKRLARMVAAGYLDEMPCLVG